MPLRKRVSSSDVGQPSAGMPNLICISLIGGAALEPEHAVDPADVVAALLQKLLDLAESPRS